MLLTELAKSLTEKTLIGGDAEISGISYDSRDVKTGDLFVAWKGEHYDGHDFINDAVSRGAAAVMSETVVEIPVPVLLVPSSRKAMPIAACAFYGNPSRRLRLVGVTGTNGKTSTTFFLQSIFEAAGFKAGLVGTLGARIGGRVIETEHTTPESVDIQRVLARMVDEGVEAVAMEVSSHGLAQGRTDALEFDCGVFTNLTQDHLDYHGTLDDYLSAKLRLFSEYPLYSSKKFVASVNVDDPSAESVIAAVNGEVITYGIKSPSDVRGDEINVSDSGVSLVITSGGRSARAYVPVGGYFSAYNALAAAAAGIGLGIDLNIVAEGLSRSRKVPGRFESIECGQDFGVVVDYAHTPDGLENVLTTAKELTKNRLIVVFGCGGDRDRTKRPIMGRIASEIADVVIVTSDNPRTENPEIIVREILEGIPTEKKDVTVLVDRGEAIRHAVNIAEPGDTIVIAGKGHEDYQIFADRTIHFDDREVAAAALMERLNR